MNAIRIGRSDVRLLILVVLVAALSVIYVRAYFWAAFPQASIDLKFSKEQITQKAESFLRSQNLDPSRFRNLTLFEDDDNARMYLERELGLDQANRLMSGPVSVWRWRARWFQPPDKEELLAYLSPDGRLVGYNHVIQEEAPGARSTAASARAIAEDFLKQRTSEPQKLIEEHLQDRPNRLDHVFTWEQEGFRAKDATYRRTIVVQGDRVGEYREYLHVPEAWQRDFQALRSKNNLYSTIAESLYVPLGLAAIACIFVFLRRRDLHWGPLVLIAGTVGVLMVVNTLNGLPFTVDRMPTSSPIPQSVAMGMLGALGAGVAVFLYVILAAAAGEPLYRADFPNRLSLLRAFSPRGIRTREFFRATVVGYGFAAAHIAFVVAFYVLGQKVGVWSPQDVAYSDLLSTVIPWIYPLTISMMAASSEEFWFRLFAIPLLRRAMPVWLAVIIPAFVWGFLHANYPQQPGYIRGVEVGLIGVAAGFLMLRFGILATLVWHYTVDAFMIGMFLFQAPSLYFKLSGAVVAGVVMLPLIVSLISYKRYGGFLADEELDNAAVQPLPAPEVASLPEDRPEPTVPRWPVRYLYIAAAVALACGLGLKTIEYGDFIKIKLSRPQAVALADAEMNRRGLKPESWRSSAQFLPNLNQREIEYAREVAGAETANRTQAERKATAVWFVRYFRPLQKEEWDVSVSREGRVYRVDHVLDEKAPGANLAMEDARSIGERYLKETQGIDPARLRLVDSQQEKRDRRTDYNFVWEDPAFHIGEAKARVTLSVIGDEVAYFRRFIKLPEEWVRHYDRPRWQQVALPGMIGASLLPLVIIFIKRLGGGKHTFHWGTYAALTALGMAIQAATYLNAWPLFFAGYDTAQPIRDYQTSTILSDLLATLLMGLGVFLAVLAIDIFRQSFEGDRRVRGVSLARAAAVALLIWGAGSAVEFAAARLPGPSRRLPLWNIEGLGTLFPAVASIHSTGVAALLALTFIVIGGCALKVNLNSRWQAPVAGLFVLAYSLSVSETLLQGAFHFAAGCCGIALLILIWGACGMDLRSYAAAMCWLALAEASVPLFTQPLTELQANAASLIAAGALLFFALKKDYGSS